MKQSWVLFLFLAIFASPLHGASDQPRRGGTLTLAVRRDLVIMNPLVGTRSTEQAIRDLMYDALLGIDLKGNVQPKLAERWEISRDGKVYTFYLRRGVKFHDGREMTAEDVKFSMDYTMNPKNGAYGNSKLALIEKVEAVDRATLRVTMKKPSPSFLFSLTDIRSFPVVQKGAVPEGVDKPSRFPPGTGPFKFMEWQPGQRIVFERYDDYWGQKAFIDRLILRPIDDDTVRITALRAGDIDMIERTPHEWVKQILDGKLKGIAFTGSPYAGFRRLRFNVPEPPFNNKKLRQAVAHAIDKTEILRAAYFGFGEAVDQDYPKGHAWYIDGVPSPAYDLAKARLLLKEAGYKGETLDIMVARGERDEVEAAMLQAQLKKIGMNIKLEVLESGSYTSRIRSGRFTFYFGGGSFDADPSSTYQYLVCEPDLKKRGLNSTGYCDKEMDLLLNKAETEMDAGKRREIIKQILAKKADEAPEFPIGFVPRFFTFRESVKGFTTDTDGQFRWSAGGLNYTWIDK